MGAAQVLHFTVTLESIECANCGMTFALPANLLRTARERGNSAITIYCPQGHQNVWREGEVERLQKQLRAKEAEVEREKNNARFYETLNEQTGRKLVAQKGITTKLRKRVSHGVCPCCKRTFQQLARHMANQHPGYGKSDETASE